MLREVALFESFSRDKKEGRTVKSQQLLHWCGGQVEVQPGEGLHELDLGGCGVGCERDEGEDEVAAQGHQHPRQHMDIFQGLEAADHAGQLVGYMLKRLKECSDIGVNQQGSGSRVYKAVKP